MAFFSSRPPARVMHDGPLFEQADFAAEYSSQVGKSTPDFRPMLNYLCGQIGPAQRAEVLEVGPGPGWISIQLAQARPAVRVTGIDISDVFVAIANENSRREGVADRVTFALGNAEEMKGFKDESFDVVFSHQSLHYWDAPERALNEISRVLKPSGIFCIGDDRRDMNWRGKLVMRVGRLFVSRRIGAVWGRAVFGCFTPSEAMDLLQRTALRDRWQIALSPRSMLITSKPRE